jgi:hypothetical protein
MPSEVFIKGFRYELSNRAFALRVMQHLAKSSERYEQFHLWSAYLALEQFNEPRYQMAAACWGLDSSPSFWVAVKAWTVRLVPRAFHSALLKVVHAATVAYVEKLKVLQSEGPSEAHSFLSYMVDQEELQVEMMERAMAGRYLEIERFVAEFIIRSAVESPAISSLSPLLKA